MAQGFTSQPTVIFEEVAEKNTQALDYDNDGNLVYIGEAEPGSVKSNPVWAIKRLIYDINGDVSDVLWANGTSEKIHIWDDRTTLIYS
jgi:hypothetical protein